MVKIGLVIFLSFMTLGDVCAQDYKHEKDIVYGYKDGMALVMDVFTPDGELNGAGIIAIMAGGMNSHPIWSHYAGSDTIFQSLLKEGYVIFAVAHSSQPKYNADDITGNTEYKENQQGDNTTFIYCFSYLFTLSGKNNTK